MMHGCEVCEAVWVWLMCSESNLCWVLCAFGGDNLSGVRSDELVRVMNGVQIIILFVISWRRATYGLEKRAHGLDRT